MPKLNGKLPKYRRHKVSGQGIVTLNGVDHYLGPHGESESRQKYDRLIAQWLASGRRNATECDAAPATSAQVSLNAVIADYWTHAQAYYRKPDGSPTSEIETLRQALKPLILLYGDGPADDFSPLKLKAVRLKMIELGWCRSHINKQVSRIKSLFRWATEEELVNGSIYHSLLAVKGLKPGRSEAPESEPVRPVPEAHIAAIKSHVSRQVWAMIQLQLLTGARPGEVANLRPLDLETSGDVWACELHEHKTAHHGHKRTIYLGPQAQAIVNPFLASRRVDACLFSPAEAEAERRAKLHESRKTPLSCGNRPGTNRQSTPALQPGTCYDVASYRRAIARGCDLAFPPPAPLARGAKETHAEWAARLTPDQASELRSWQREHRWHPHQLRHNAATRIRRSRGLDAARAVLGHRSPAITEVYAELDENLAVSVARETG